MALAATFAVKAISGFRSEVVETFGLLGCSAAHVVNWLPKFWYSTTYRPASSSKVKQFKKNIHPLTAAVLRAPLKETHCVLGGRY